MSRDIYKYIPGHENCSFYICTSDTITKEVAATLTTMSIKKKSIILQ